MVQNTMRASPGSFSGGRSMIAEYSQRSRGSIGEIGMAIGAPVHWLLWHDKARARRVPLPRLHLLALRHIRGRAKPIVGLGCSRPRRAKQLGSRVTRRVAASIARELALDG